MFKSLLRKPAAPAAAADKSVEVASPLQSGNLSAATGTAAATPLFEWHPAAAQPRPAAAPTNTMASGSHHKATPGGTTGGTADKKGLLQLASEFTLFSSTSTNAVVEEARKADPYVGAVDRMHTRLYIVALVVAMVVLVVIQSTKINAVKVALASVSYAQWQTLPPDAVCVPTTPIVPLGAFAKLQPAIMDPCILVRTRTVECSANPKCYNAWFSSALLTILNTTCTIANNTLATEVVSAAQTPIFTPTVATASSLIVLASSQARNVFSRVKNVMSQLIDGQRLFDVSPWTPSRISPND